MTAINSLKDLIGAIHAKNTKEFVEECLSEFAKLGIEVTGQKITDWGTDNPTRKYIALEVGDLHFETYVDLLPNGHIDRSSFAVLAKNSERTSDPNSTGYITYSETLPKAIALAKGILDTSVSKKERAYTQEKHMRSLLG